MSGDGRTVAADLSCGLVEGVDFFVGDASDDALLVLVLVRHAEIFSGGLPPVKGCAILRWQATFEQGEPVGRKLELAGRRFGRLVVLSEAGRNLDGKVTWLCLCDCGNTTVKSGPRLKSGVNRSCGCLIGGRNATHRMKGTRIYRIWANMLSRTRNPNASQYAVYGGRGITVCERWQSFENFYADMGPTYTEGLTIDRINSDGNYEPANCRWATPLEQGRNTRRNKWITYSGHTLIMSEWAAALGIPYKRLVDRDARGWSPERALTEGVPTEHLASVLRELDQNPGSYAATKPKR